MIRQGCGLLSMIFKKKNCCHYLLNKQSKQKSSKIHALDSKKTKFKRKQNRKLLNSGSNYSRSNIQLREY